MKIYVSGVNHRTTPLEIREKFNFTDTQLRQALKEFWNLDSVDECIIISTCNRTEVYIYSNDEEFDINKVETLLCEIKDIDLGNSRKYFYAYQGIKAVRHIFKVASGLDSLVLGEDQILGQVKRALDISIEVGASSSILNTLFRQAITAAKQIKTNTDLSKNSLSIASIAIKHIEGVFKNGLSSKTALVIGAGKMGSIAFKNLIFKGINKVYVTKRSHGIKREILESNKNVSVIDYDERYSVINECDIIISSTASPHYTITADVLKKYVNISKQRVFVDLAVPRDLDVDISLLDGAKYFNIDDLQEVAGNNIYIRQMEANKAEDIINEFIVEFEKWFEFRSVLPIVKDIQKFTDEILEEKIYTVISKLRTASDEDVETIKLFMKSTVKEIIGTFVYDVKDNIGSEDIKSYFRCLANVINIKKD